MLMEKDLCVKPALDATPPGGYLAKVAPLALSRLYFLPQALVTWQFGGAPLCLGQAAVLTESRMLVEFELIQKAQAGDGAAFNQVVVAYRKRILGTIARLIGRPEDVEDVAQEVFLRLYYSLDQLRTPEVFEPWLYRLTVNASYDYLRKQRRRNEARMSDLSEQQVMMADAAAGGKVSSEENRLKQVKDLVDALLGSVSEQDRILLTLKEVEGLSLKELEKIYGVNENALKVRLFRARQRVLNAFEATQKGRSTKPVERKS